MPNVQTFGFNSDEVKSLLSVPDAKPRSANDDSEFNMLTEAVAPPKKLWQQAQKKKVPAVEAFLNTSVALMELQLQKENSKNDEMKKKNKDMEKKLDQIQELLSKKDE